MKSLEISASALPKHLMDYGPAAALLSVAAVVIDLRYRIDRKADAAIITMLAKRR